MPESGSLRALGRAAPALAVAAATALAVRVLAPEWWAASVGLVVAYVATPLAKEAWIPVAHAEFGLPLAYVAMLVLLVNASFSLLALFALPVERAPLVGGSVQRFGERVRGSRFARRGAALALFAGVAAPIHSGGAIVGSLAGRVLGLTRTVTFAAVMGAITLRTLAVVLVVYGVTAAAG